MNKQLLLALSLMVTINVSAQPQDIVVHLAKEKTTSISTGQLTCLKSKSATIQHMFEDIADGFGELYLPYIKRSSFKLLMKVHNKSGEALCSDLKKLHEKKIHDLMQTANYLATEELLDASAEEFSHLTLGDNHTEQLLTRPGRDTYYQNLGLLEDLQKKVAQQFVKTKIALSLTELAKKPIREFKKGSGLVSVAFNSEGSYLATGALNGEVNILDVRTGEKLQQFKNRVETLSIALDPTGQYIAMEGYDRKLYILTIKTGEILKKFDYKGAQVTSVVFNSAGTCIATGDMDGMLRIFNIGTGELTEQAFANHRKIVAFDGKGVWVAVDNKRVYIESEKAADNIRKKPLFASMICSIAFDPSDQYLAIGSLGYCCYRACIFDLEKREQKYAFEHESLVCSVAFDPTGKYLATGSAKKARIFDVETGEELQQFEHSDLVYSVAFDASGEYLATGSFDKKACIWIVMSKLEKVMQDLTLEQAQLVTLLITKKILLNAMPEHMEELYKDLPEMIRDLLEAPKPEDGISKRIGDAYRNLVQKIKGSG